MHSTGAAEGAAADVPAAARPGSGVQGAPKAAASDSAAETKDKGAKRRGAAAESASQSAAPAAKAGAAAGAGARAAVNTGAGAGAGAAKAGTKAGAGAKANVDAGVAKAGTKAGAGAKVAADAGAGAAKADAGAQPRPQPAAGTAAGASSVIGKMMAKLQGGRFRSLNEQLYTSSGDDALDMMQQSPELFRYYHEGFQQQTLGWPKQPVDVAVKWLATLPASLVVADFGCGDAKLMRSVKQKVHSFDLVSSAPGVVACNMADVPLADSSIDAAVFSLALMGTDYGSFLGEACRVLKPKGWLWIAEVRSRFSNADGKENFKPFLSCLAKLGFKLQSQDAGNKMFVTWLLRKDPQLQASAASASAIQWPPLKACVYKRR